MQCHVYLLVADGCLICYVAVECLRLQQNCCHCCTHVCKLLYCCSEAEQPDSSPLAAPSAVDEMQVEKSVEKVLEDMKKKYQDALDQMGGAQANAVQAETDLDMIKQVQQQKMDEIKQLCE